MGFEPKTRDTLNGVDIEIPVPDSAYYWVVVNEVDALDFFFCRRPLF